MTTVDISTAYVDRDADKARARRDHRANGIGLSKRNADKLRNAFAPYLAAGSKVGRGRIVIGGRAARGRGRAAGQIVALVVALVAALGPGGGAAEPAAGRPFERTSGWGFHRPPQGCGSAHCRWWTDVASKPRLHPGQGELVRVKTPFYGYNPHTDVEQVTDETGDTRATYGYTAYGKPRPQPLYAMFAIILHHGLRRGEAVGLRNADA